MGPGDDNTKDDNTLRGVPEQRLEELLVKARREVECLKRVHQIGGYGEALIALSADLDEASSLIELFGKSLLGETLLGTTKLYVRTQDWLKNRKASKGVG